MPEDPSLPIAKWVLESEDRILSIFDRRISNDSSRVRAIYEVLKDDPRPKDVIKDVARDLNAQLFFRDLTILGEDITGAVAEVSGIGALPSD